MVTQVIRLAVLSSALAVSVDAMTAPATQVAAVTEAPLRAIGNDAARRQASPPDAQTSYFANILPALSGDAGIDHIDPVPGYQFATLKLVMSVAPAIYAGSQDISGGQATGALGALRHLSAHITVKPIDGAGQVVEVKRTGPLVLATLEI